MTFDLGDSLLAAASLVHDAALSLASHADEVADRDHYLRIAARLGSVLDANPTRSEVLAVSPQKVGPTGRVQTLIEMIENEPGDQASRIRLVILLMKALVWEPSNPSSARGVIRENRELLRYQRQLIDRRLDELRRSRATKFDP